MKQIQFFREYNSNLVLNPSVDSGEFSLQSQALIDEVENNRYHYTEEDLRKIDEVKPLIHSLEPKARNRLVSVVSHVMGIGKYDLPQVLANYLP